MATKNSSGISSLQKQIGRQKKQEIQTEMKDIPVEETITDLEPVKKETSAEKRKVGRPKTKTEETRTINIAVPISVLQKLDTVKICYENNLTLYINKLIEKDLEVNGKNYKKITDSLNIFL